jgi:glucose-1-phosphatase
MQREFKNIIFDLGGVILNIDYNLTEKAFRKLGADNFKEMFSQAKQEMLFDKIEKGLISSQDFITRIKTICKGAEKEDDIIAAWNAMLLDLPQERTELLKKLKSKYRTFLLSNTNEIHIKAYAEYLFTRYGFRNLESFFEKEYLSYQIGMRKPDKEIFEYVLKENNLNPSETLFIDDSPQHIEGAAVTGIHAVWLAPGKTILDLFDEKDLTFKH